MRLEKNVVIPKEKLTEYLLLPRRRNDKSGYLARAGYSLKNWARLEADLRELARTQDAEPSDQNAFGEFRIIRRQRRGPNQVILKVKTIWIRLSETNETRFVTLVPDTEE